MSMRVGAWPSASRGAESGQGSPAGWLVAGFLGEEDGRARGTGRIPGQVGVPACTWTVERRPGGCLSVTPSRLPGVPTCSGMAPGGCRRAPIATLSPSLCELIWWLSARSARARSPVPSLCPARPPRAGLRALASGPSARRLCVHGSEPCWHPSRGLRAAARPPLLRLAELHARLGTLTTDCFIIN